MDIGNEKEDETHVLDKILSAEIHLVNIQAPEPAHVRANHEEETYTGIYGDFCELNFALHKQDPSSGMWKIVVFHLISPLAPLTHLLFHKKSQCFETWSDIHLIAMNIDIV